MPLDTEFLSKNPSIRLHRPSVRPSVSLHPFPRCPISIQVMNYWHTGFPILNKLGVNGVAVEVLFFSTYFSFPVVNNTHNAAGAKF